MRRIIVRELKQVYDLECGQLELSPQQHDWLEQRSEFFDQLNGAHWIGADAIRELAVLHPGQDPQPFYEGDSSLRLKDVYQQILKKDTQDSAKEIG